MKRGICKLCLKETEICVSHIIPKFAIKRIKDEEQRLFFVCNEFENPCAQDGFKEYMLCKNCEDKISLVEKYIQNLFFRENIKGDRFEEVLIANNVDYKKFKLFVISLIWRAGVTEIPEIKNNVTLGKKHEERMRQMLLEDEPGEELDYCTLITTNEFKKDYKPSAEEDTDYSKVVGYPVSHRLGGVKCYIYFLFGFKWITFVSNHYPEEIKGGILKKDGTFHIMRGAEDKGVLNKEMRRILNEEKPKRRFSKYK